MSVRSKFIVLCAAFIASAAFAADVTSHVDVDNSGKNVRDRKDHAVTADSQMDGSKSDVEITREIRRAITKDDALSTSAHNVKIITKNKMVVLRGPVETATESEKIAEIAKKSPGVLQVKNSLEIKK